MLSVFLVIIFALSVFKHLSYPLLWNDEAEAIMHSKRVTEYGFPKVSDGKNKVYPILLPKHPDFAIEKDSDAYLGFPWGMFYFGTISVYLSDLTNDIYEKTFLARFPFALFGFLGVLLIPFLLAKSNNQKMHYHAFNIYLFFCILSVPIALHIRELRYYSLMPILQIVIFYFHFKLIRNYSLKGVIIYAFLLFISYQVFPPLLFINAIFLVFSFTFQYAFSKYKLKKVRSDLFKSLILIGTFSLIITTPVLFYFKAFEMTKVTSEFNYFSWSIYKKHLIETINYLFEYEILMIFIFIIISYTLLNINKLITCITDNLYIIHLLGFCFIYFLIINRVPGVVYFRYLIVLILIGIYIVSILLKNILTEEIKPIYKIAFLVICTSLVLYKVVKLKDVLIGHGYELSHQYKGVLDYTIPYIIDNYTKPEELVIATNYEECSYMFYLNSKVTYGYVGNNLKEDSLITPDIINFRKTWWHDKKLFDKHLNNNTYIKKTFPVVDYQTNNIPDLTSHYSHLFRTFLPDAMNKPVEIFLLNN